MTTAIRLAVVGAGLIGRQHAQRVLDLPGMDLACLVDPFLTPQDNPFAGQTDLLPDLPEALGRVDGVILATPNTAHRDGALAAIAAGIPALVEKPIADTVPAGAAIAEASEAGGVPVLVGHHRRHSPLLARAQRAIADGEIGEPVAVTGSALFRKPDEYFDAAPWRTRPGGGPILINLIHDVDDLRMLCGEITRVHATASNHARGFAVEDTAAIVFAFASGALGTFIVSDAAASVRSWEQTSGENPAYDMAPEEDCYHIAGTRGSISVPTLRLRTYRNRASWSAASTTRTLLVEAADPLVRQLDHFGQVIRGICTPAVTVRDGLQSLRVVHAVAESARTGRPVDLPLDGAARPAALSHPSIKL